METLHLVYACVGAAAVGLALTSRKLRELPVSEPLVGLALGVLLGPAVLGLVTLEEPTRDVVLLEGSRLLLAWSVTAAALRFPGTDLRPVLGPVLLLLLVVMPLMALLSGAAALLLGLPLALAAVVGTCLCPTDPVLAASVVTGEPAEKGLAARLREVLTAERFGPIGVSAIFYVAHSIHEGVSDPRLFAAGTLAIAASVVAFGVSGTPGRKAYVRAGDRSG